MVSPESNEIDCIKNLIINLITDPRHAIQYISFGKLYAAVYVNPTPKISTESL